MTPMTPPGSSSGSPPVTPVRRRQDDSSAEAPLPSGNQGESLAAEYSYENLRTLASLDLLHVVGAKDAAHHQRNPLEHVLLYGIRVGERLRFNHRYVCGKHSDSVGRKYSSVQNYKRPIRAFLFAGIYDEFDAKSCQLTIMLTWAARSYKLALPALRHYVSRT
mmetsp:Transcript_24619/g.62315  ORF Transcript_24619/g.62315 Transcript_24619/m.62315 type:complete len:163 (-) Transcript_24619:50-538(-)